LNILASKNILVDIIDNFKKGYIVEEEIYLNRTYNEIIFGGRRLTAEEAMSWGIVNKVAPSAELMDTARALAAEICLSAPLSVAAVLDIIRTTEDLSIAESYAAMRNNEAYLKAINSEDAMEGPNAFAEKRDPVWKGK
jgi:crotonobetainyl-CoA hydratase